MRRDGLPLPKRLTESAKKTYHVLWVFHVEHETAILVLVLGRHCAVVLEQFVLNLQRQLFDLRARQHDVVGIIGPERRKNTLIMSILPYACETWTLTTELQRIKAMEIRCYQRLLNISYKDHITNATACNKIQAAIGPHEETLTTVKKGSYDGLDVCVVRSCGFCKKILLLYQGKEEGKRKDEGITSRIGQA